jgi:hypothetical protein
MAIGFTGHRSLEDEDQCRQWILDFLRRQISSIPALVCGVSSVAAGGDLLFAESCIQLALPLCVLLPLPLDEFRQDFTPADWARAEQVLSKAASVEFTAGSQSREECYYECGIETVQQSRLLLALWNGEPSQGLGGTEDIVSFARGIGRPVIWLHSTRGEVLTFNEKTAKELLDDPELDFLNHLPEPPEGPEPGASQGTNQPGTLARSWFRKVDGSATRLAPQSRRLAAIPIVLTAAAVLFSRAGSWARDAGTWLTAGMAFGIMAALLPVVLRMQKRQALWVRTRTAAEVCRSVLAFWSTPACYGAIGPEAVPELRGVLMSLNLQKVLDRGRGHPSVEEFKERYRQERIAGQMEYLSAHAEQSAAEARRYRAATGISIGLAAGLNAWLFVSGRLSSGFALGPWKQSFALGAAIAFQIATVAGALLAVNDCDRRRQRYRELHQQLEEWEAQLEALRTWPSVLRVAGRIERALLTELIEWRSLIRNQNRVRK